MGGGGRVPPGPLHGLPARLSSRPPPPLRASQCSLLLRVDKSKPGRPVLSEARGRGGTGACTRAALRGATLYAPFPTLLTLIHSTGTYGTRGEPGRAGTAAPAGGAPCCAAPPPRGSTPRHGHHRRRRIRLVCFRQPIPTSSTPTTAEPAGDSGQPAATTTTASHLPKPAPPSATAKPKPPSSELQPAITRTTVAEPSLA